MTWKPFIRPTTGRGSPLAGKKASLNKQGELKLAAGALALWSELPSFVRLYYDPSRRAVALDPKGDAGDWRLRSTGQKNGLHVVSLKSLMKHYGLAVGRAVRMDVALEGGRLVVEIPEDDLVPPEEVEPG